MLAKVFYQFFLKFDSNIMHYNCLKKEKKMLSMYAFIYVAVQVTGS